MPAAPLPVHIMLSKRKPTQPTMQHHSVYMNYNRYKKVILWMQTYAWNLQSKPRKLFWQNQDKRHLLKIPEGKGQIFSSLSPMSGTSQTHRETSLSGCYFMKAWLLAVFSVTLVSIPSSRFQTEQSYNCPCLWRPPHVCCGSGSTHYEVSHSWRHYCILVNDHLKNISFKDLSHWVPTLLVTLLSSTVPALLFPQLWTVAVIQFWKRILT